jgi:hypothetical protein
VNSVGETQFFNSYGGHGGFETICATSDGGKFVDMKISIQYY